MPYVYILNEYSEDGPDKVCATLDRLSLRNLLKKNWPRPIGDDLDAQPGFEQWRQKSHDEWMASALDGLTKQLEKTDAELADVRHGHNCQSGWGGLQLHVVKLD